MKFHNLFLIAVALSILSCLAAAETKISGDYLETRSADVYTGQCFANGEVGLTGDAAILAWHIRSGSWNGVDLNDLNVVAAVKANATLGDPYADPYPAKAVLILMSKRNRISAQRSKISHATWRGNCLRTW